MATCASHHARYSAPMVVGEFSQDADVAVIGAGPAGYACAFAAADAGRDVTLVDPHTTPGGHCLAEACIPSKTLLHAAAARIAATSAGLLDDPPDLDAAALSKWIRRCVNRLGKGLAGGADQRKITLLQGRARFLNGRELQVAGEEVTRLRFKRAVVCTGSTRVEHSVLGDVQDIAGPEALLADPSLAAGRVAVIGSDVVAIETATIAAALGAEVCLHTDGQPVLPDIPELLTEALLKTSGLPINTTPLQTRPEADVIIDAASRTAAIDSLNLGETDVQLQNGWIAVNDQMQTDATRVLAAGDCVGPPLWAGAALAQGRVAAETIIGKSGRWDPTAISNVIFGPIELCWCGDATQHDDIATHSVPWTYSGLAVAMGAPDGLTLIRWDRSSSTILGVGAVGRGAAEFATAATIAVEMGVTLQDLADMVPAHPTRGELIHEAAIQAMQLP